MKYLTVLAILLTGCASVPPKRVATGIAIVVVAGVVYSAASKDGSAGILTAKIPTTPDRAAAR